MPAFDVKLRVKITETRDFGYVRIEAEDGEAACRLFEEQVREEYDYPGEYVALEEDAVEVLDWIPTEED